MSWFRKQEESPFDHFVCKDCGKVGHRQDMLCIDGEAWGGWDEEYNTAFFGSSFAAFVGVSLDYANPVWVHKDCSPLRKRGMLGGWELTERGEVTLDKAREARGE